MNHLENSNTTLVKVKLFNLIYYKGVNNYSNTTLVKVKLGKSIFNGMQIQLFKYNTC